MSTSLWAKMLILKPMGMPKQQTQNPGWEESCFFFFCKVWWFDGVLSRPCDQSRCGAWQETLRRRSPPPCGRLLLRRKGCCDFAFLAYISAHLRMPFTLGQSGAHTEYLLLRSGTACPFSHLVLLCFSHPPLFFPPSACHILLFPLLLNLCNR